jgi:hypothetical protein
MSLCCDDHYSEGEGDNYSEGDNDTKTKCCECGQKKYCGITVKKEKLKYGNTLFPGYGSRYDNPQPFMPYIVQVNEFKKYGELCDQCLLNHVYNNHIVLDHIEPAFNYEDVPTFEELLANSYHDLDEKKYKEFENERKIYYNDKDRIFNREWIFGKKNDETIPEKQKIILQFFTDSFHPIGDLSVAFIFEKCLKILDCKYLFGEFTESLEFDKDFFMFLLNCDQDYATLCVKSLKIMNRQKDENYLKTKKSSKDYYDCDKNYMMFVSKNIPVWLTKK